MLTFGSTFPSNSCFCHLLPYLTGAGVPSVMKGLLRELPELSSTEHSWGEALLHHLLHTLLAAKRNSLGHSQPCTNGAKGRLFNLGTCLKYNLQLLGHEVTTIYLLLNENQSNVLKKRGFQLSALFCPQTDKQKPAWTMNGNPYFHVQDSSAQTIL